MTPGTVSPILRSEEGKRFRMLVITKYPDSFKAYEKETGKA